MNFVITLDPKPPLPGSSPISRAAQLVALRPGVYRTKLRAWEEAEGRQYSAWNTWNGTVDLPRAIGWMNSFFVGRWTGMNVDQASIQVVGTPRPQGGVFETPETAFAAYPQHATFSVPPRSDGSVLPIPMLFWLQADYYGEVGQMQIEVSYQREFLGLG